MYIKDSYYLTLYFGFLRNTSISELGDIVLFIEPQKLDFDTQDTQFCPCWPQGHRV